MKAIEAFQIIEAWLKSKGLSLELFYVISFYSTTTEVSLQAHYLGQIMDIMEGAETNSINNIVWEGKVSDVKVRICLTD